MTKPTYPHDTSWTLERGDGEVEVLVEYAVEERGCDPSGMFGPPEDYDPGSGWVFAINESVFSVCPDGPDPIATLTPTEIDAIHAWLEENHEDDSDGSFYDY